LKSIPYKFIILALLFFVIDFTIDSINHNLQLNDLKVYYGASVALLGKQQVYGKLFSLGSGYYKYSPFIALLFSPLTLLPYNIACVFHFAITSLSILFSALVSYKLFNKYYFKSSFKHGELLLSLSVICVGTHFNRELIMGNVNAILLLCLTLFIYQLLNGKGTIAALLFAFVIITKPFFAILFVPLFLYKYYRVIIISTLFIASFILITIAVSGISYGISLHVEWLKALLDHASGFPSSNSIQSIIANYIYPDVSKRIQYILLGAFLITYSFFTWKSNRKTNKEEEKPKAFILEWFLLIALTPSLFNTDTEHFLMSFPVVMFLLFYIFTSKNIPFIIIFILCIILYNGNSADLLGRELSIKIEHMGILGISNIILAGLTIFAFTRYKRDELLVNNP
jgi:hypothetical protein